MAAQRGQEGTALLLWLPRTDTAESSAKISSSAPVPDRGLRSSPLLCGAGGVREMFPQRVGSISPCPRQGLVLPCSRGDLNTSHHSISQPRQGTRPSQPAGRGTALFRSAARYGDPRSSQPPTTHPRAHPDPCKPPPRLRIAHHGTGPQGPRRARRLHRGGSGYRHSPGTPCSHPPSSHPRVRLGKALLQR